MPWAALASCWPLPQQLLPVSAAGGGRRRCTLAIFSGIIIFNFASPKRLRSFRRCFFTERGRTGKRHLCQKAQKNGEADSFRQTLRVCHLPLGGRQPSPSSLRDATSPERGRFIASDRKAKGSLFEGAVAAGDWGSLPRTQKSPGEQGAPRGI